MERLTEERRGGAARSPLTEHEYEHLVSKAVRRVALDVIIDEGTPVTVAEIARTAAIRLEPDMATEEDLAGHLEIRYHHLDLPKLADRGLIQYDPDRKLVTALRTTEFLES